MPRHRVITCVFGLLLFCGAAPAAAEQTRVTAEDDKTCLAHLRVPENSSDLPLMISFNGTGLSSSSFADQIDPVAMKLFRQRKAVLLTLDKPGVEPDLKNPGKLMVNDQQYNRYVQDDLILCTIRYLELRPELTQNVLLSGHSEGAQIALRIVNELIQSKSPLAVRVRALFLSGLPLGPWRTMLTRQLDDVNRLRFFRALSEKDDATLRAFGDLTSTYLENIFRQEPLEQTYDRVMQQHVDLQVFIYQGMYDRLTPAQPVHEITTAGRRLPGERLLARFYPAGHQLNARALLDIRRDIEQIILGFKDKVRPRRPQMPS